MVIRWTVIVLAIAFLVYLAFFLIKIRGKTDCKRAAETFQQCRMIVTDMTIYAPIPSAQQASDCREFYTKHLPRLDTTSKATEQCSIGASDQEIRSTRQDFNRRMKALKLKELPDNKFSEQGRVAP